jgi:tripartite-type tricarboxylate transporter receptor subunit TctC
MRRAAAIALGLALAASGAHADNFYKGKQLRLIAGFPAGNDYDLGARLLVKYLPKYIPGEPGIIVQNMPQAASVAATNYLYNQAPRDGTVLGSFSRNIVNDALTGQPNLIADPRHFRWLGATSRPSRVCVRWYTAPVQTPADLFTHEFIVGAAGATSSLAILPTVLNNVLGTKFRIVEGYQGMGDTLLAVQRGELQGACASFQQFRIVEQPIRDGKMTYLLRAEETPIAGIPDVPSIFDYAKTDEQRQLMALRVLVDGIRPALCVPARSAAGSCRHHAQGHRRRGARSGPRRRSRHDEDGHDLHGAGSPGTIGRQAL